MDTNEIFAARLRGLREKQGRSMKVVSQLAGLHSTAVYEYERENRVPSLASAVKLADYFEVSVDYLTGREEAVG